jgi:hypothetical protein
VKKCDFRSNHLEFDVWIRWYGDFIKKIIDAERVIRKRHEKMELVEAIVLRAAVRWDVLVEQDIVSSINRDASVYAKALNLRLRKHLTKDECKAMIVGHRFLDFKSVGDVKNFGRRFLNPDLNPFDAITGPQEDKINEFLGMRNLLAHYSDYAWRSYYAFMQSKYKYAKVPEPGDFLITLTPNGRTYRWADYFLNFLNVSIAMIKALKI